MLQFLLLRLSHFPDPFLLWYYFFLLNHCFFKGNHNTRKRRASKLGDVTTQWVSDPVPEFHLSVDRRSRSVNVTIQAGQKVRARLCYQRDVCESVSDSSDITVSIHCEVGVFGNACVFVYQRHWWIQFHKHCVTFIDCALRLIHFTLGAIHLSQLSHQLHKWYCGL